MQRVGKLSQHMCAAQAATAQQTPDEAWLFDSSKHRIDPFVQKADIGESMLPEEAKHILTPEQMEQYDRDGFILIRKLFSREEINLWKQRFEDICEQRVDAPNNMLIMRDIALAKQKKEKDININSVTKVQDFEDEPVLFTFCQHPKLREYVRAFCGTNFRSIHTMVISKPPDLGQGSSRHPMHQDLYYFPLRSSNRIVGTWAAMEEKINRENGGLSVIPGSHRAQLLLKHGDPSWEGGSNALYHGILGEVDMENRVHLDMEIGDCVFFHPLLHHGSGRNETQGFRKAISTHFASGLCKFNPVPLEIIDGALTAKKIPKEKLSWSLKQRFYREIWKIKSRQIEGEEPSQWTPSDAVSAEFFDAISS